MRIIRNYVRKLIVEYIEEALLELDKDKYYILLLPEGVDENDIREQIGSMADKINLTVLIVDNAKLLELT